MTGYHRRFRSCPLSIALVLPPLYAWFVWPALGEGWPGVWQLGPVMALFTYGMLFCFLNRVDINVNARGVWMRKGPLPVAPQAPPILREHITQVYVRRAIYQVKGVTKEYLAAGVLRIDGACLDLTEELLPDDIVRQHAAAIAAALEWPYPLAEIDGEVLNLEASLLYAYLGWAGALMVSLVWIGIAGALRLGGN